MDIDPENENDNSKDNRHGAGFRYLENIFLLESDEGGYKSENYIK